MAKVDRSGERGQSEKGVRPDSAADRWSAVASCPRQGRGIPGLLRPINYGSESSEPGCTGGGKGIQTPGAPARGERLSRSAALAVCRRDDRAEIPDGPPGRGDRATRAAPPFTRRQPWPVPASGRPWIGPPVSARGGPGACGPKATHHPQIRVLGAPPPARAGSIGLHLRPSGARPWPSHAGLRRPGPARRPELARAPPITAQRSGGGASHGTRAQRVAKVRATLPTGATLPRR